MHILFLGSKKQSMYESYIRKQKLSQESSRNRQYVREYVLSLSNDSIYELFFKDVKERAEGCCFSVCNK